MLSKDVTVINGMVRTKDSIKMKDKIVNYRGQMIDVGAGSMGDWSSICSIPGNPTNPIGAWGKTEQEAIENIKPKIDKVLSNKTKDEGKYKIYWINHNYYSQEEFNTLEEARKYADSKSFEYRIDLNGKPVASGGALRGFRMMDKKTKDDMAVGNIKEIDYKGYQIQLRRYENYVGWKILKNGSLISNGQNFYSENRAVEEAKKDIDKLTKDKKMKDAMTESQVKASCKQAGREFLADKTKDDSGWEEVKAGDYIALNIGGGFVEKARVKEVKSNGFLMQYEDGTRLVPKTDFAWIVRKG